MHQAANFAEAEGPPGTYLLRCPRGGERTSSHDSVRDAIYHIIRESRQHAHRERTGFLPSSAPRGRGGRVDIVILDAAVGHTLVDNIVAHPTRRDLVERVAIHDLVANIDAVRRKVSDNIRSGASMVIYGEWVHVLIQ